MAFYFTSAEGWVGFSLVSYCWNKMMQVRCAPPSLSHWDVCVKPSQFSGVEVDRRRRLPSPSEIGEHNTYINALNVLTVFSPGMQEGEGEKKERLGGGLL